MTVKQINKKIEKLPPHLIPEIMDYIDFLINKYNDPTGEKRSFAFSWQGGLAEISTESSSVDLQHKSMDWR